MGNRTDQLTGEDFARIRDAHRELLLDVGTGAGKRVLHLARERVDRLVVGLDASPDRMRTASRAAVRGRLGNALFIQTGVERLPPELTGATAVHVIMPWGSLLRAMITGDREVLSGLAAASRPGAALLVTVNLHAWRPPVPEVGDTTEPDPESALTTLAPRYATTGWRLAGAEYLDEAAVAALHSGWANRLRSSRRGGLAVLALTGTAADRS